MLSTSDYIHWCQNNWHQHVKVMSDCFFNYQSNGKKWLGWSMQRWWKFFKIVILFLQDYNMRWWWWWWWWWWCYVKSIFHHHCFKSHKCISDYKLTLWKRKLQKCGHNENENNKRIALTKKRQRNIQILYRHLKV